MRHGRVVAARFAQRRRRPRSGHSAPAGAPMSICRAGSAAATRSRAGPMSTRTGTIRRQQTRLAKALSAMKRRT